MQVPEDQDFRFVDWYPDEHRSSCCGYHCQKCPGGLSKDAEPYFCANDSPVRRFAHVFMFDLPRVAFRFN